MPKETSVLGYQLAVAAITNSNAPDRTSNGLSLTAVLVVLLSSFAVLAIACLMTMLYVRREAERRPRYAWFVIECVTIAGFLSMFYVLEVFGMDVRHWAGSDIYFIAIGLFVMILIPWQIYERQSGGKTLLDAGPPPRFKLNIGLGILQAVLSIMCASNATFRAQGFMFAAWSVQSLVTVYGRLEVRDRGILVNGFLPWHRIVGCIATADNTVCLTLKKGKKFEFRILPQRRDEFIQIVEDRKGGSLI